MTASSARVRRSAAGSVPAAPPNAHGIFLAALPFAVIGGVALVDVLAGPGVGFLPVLSLGPALAAISRRPLATALIGVLALACGVILAVYDDLDASRRGAIALATIVGVTGAGVIASVGRRRRERELADFKAIADAAQQILLRPVPHNIPPADIAVRYVSAAASARIGGDLYEAVSSGGGVRLIVGDVLGKGLPAARTAAVVLGAFRESAYDAVTLAEIAARIEVSLQHQEAVEEFVTVVLAEVSADGGRAEILNCGHPPPLLVREGEVTMVDSAEAGLPLGLAALLKEARQACSVVLKPGDRLLFYTDGITEARDKQGIFYPLEQSGALLGVPDLGSALDQLIEDVLGHVGHTLQDDAAILLVGLRQPLPARRTGKLSIADCRRPGLLAQGTALAVPRSSSRRLRLAGGAVSDQALALNGLPDQDVGPDGKA